MSKPSKRFKKSVELVDKNKLYSVDEAVDILKKVPTAKFDETVEMYFSLAVDVKDATQAVRGTVILPNGTGKKVRVIVFCNDENQKKAIEAGADLVGADDLVEKIQKGFMDFDVCISTPEMMKIIARLGKVLGPRGLMPSPKAGTVTPDVAKAVKEAKAGKIQYRVDKSGDIQCPAGKLSFETKAIVQNINTLIDTVHRARPASVKGKYIKSVFVSSTMGPGIKLDVSD